MRAERCGVPALPTAAIRAGAHHSRHLHLQRSQAIGVRAGVVARHAERHYRMRRRQHIAFREANAAADGASHRQSRLRTGRCGRRTDALNAGQRWSRLTRRYVQRIVLVLFDVDSGRGGQLA